MQASILLNKMVEATCKIHRMHSPTLASLRYQIVALWLAISATIPFGHAILNERTNERNANYCGTEHSYRATDAHVPITVQHTVHTHSVYCRHTHTYIHIERVREPWMCREKRQEKSFQYTIRIRIVHIVRTHLLCLQWGVLNKNNNNNKKSRYFVCFFFLLIRVWVCVWFDFIFYICVPLYIGDYIFRVSI